MCRENEHRLHPLTHRKLADTPMTNAFTIHLWTRTTTHSDTYPAIASNKNWNSGQIHDYTARDNYGHSRTSGQKPGWAIALQPNGAWAWNIGDGEKRLDYQPTPERQRLDDGAWHLLAFSVDSTRREARLYYDGQPVALYSLTDLKNNYSAACRTTESPIESADFTQIDQILTASEIAALYQERSQRPAATYSTHLPDAPLRVLAWNIWNGGREDGIDLGVERVVECIRTSGADLIAMQETYGSGPRIADALGYHLYLRSSNLSVISRYPVIEHHDHFRPFNFGGVTLELAPSRRLKLFSLWIHYLPDFCNDVQQEGMTAAQLIAAEGETRAGEMREILDELKPHLAESIPLIVAGDFNSPSHLDWVQSANPLHCNLTVEWPVSKDMAEAGFLDAYRQIYPNPTTHFGHTWTPRSPQSWQDRIDYIYYLGKGLRCQNAEVHNRHATQWPSDHAAVLASFTLI
jgi:endonuclease/exonuclease/phosphatase family metal-dependent hydrolase